jgi:transposase
MSNVLKQTKREQVRALGQLGWPLRRIEAETGVRRETIARYLRAAGIPVARPGRRGDGAAKAAIETSTDKTQGKRGLDPPGEGADEAKAAIEASTDSAPQPWPPKPQRSPQASACEVHRDLIASLVARRRNAKQIWRDLVDGHGFVHRYASVQRFVRSLRGTDAGRDAHAVIETAPGEEAQVDYGGEGPMVRDPVTGKYRRTRLFVMTLGYSRKCVRLVSWRSSAREWASLHERAFRALGGVPATIVLDNLREGVIKADHYEPTLNPLYARMLAHYGTTALTCRVRDPNRKGKVESGVRRAQDELRGLRFETLPGSQQFLDERDARWGDTRIHGTTKRQVVVMFEEERPALRALPVEPFRMFRYATRRVHLDGHIEVEAAYYSVPPGLVGQALQVQWDEQFVRILTRHGVLLREHVRSERRGRFVTERDDRPRNTRGSTRDLLTAASKVGAHTGQVCNAIFARDGEQGIRRILGVLSLAKRYGPVRIEEACGAALSMRAAEYRVVKRWLERSPSLPLTLRQVDPLIRQLTQYREMAEQLARPKEDSRDPQ